MTDESARKVWESNQPMRDIEEKTMNEEIEEKTMTDEIEYTTIEGATWEDVQDGDRVTAIEQAWGADVVKVERPVPKVELPEELGHYLDAHGYLTTHASGGWRGIYGDPITLDLIALPLSRLYTLSDAAEIIADWLRNYYSDPSANAVRREFVDGAK